MDQEPNKSNEYLPSLCCIACGDRSHEDYCQTCRYVMAGCPGGLDDGPPLMLMVLRAQEANGQIAKGRRAVLWEKYGITLECYQQMMLTQSGRCAICSKISRVLVVDHDHVTGQARGLLCSHCNIGLGMFKENAAALSAAVEYLSSARGPVGEPLYG